MHQLNSPTRAFPLKTPRSWLQFDSWPETMNIPSNPKLVFWTVRLNTSLWMVSKKKPRNTISFEGTLRQAVTIARPWATPPARAGSWRVLSRHPGGKNPREVNLKRVFMCPNWNRAPSTKHTRMSTCSDIKLLQREPHVKPIAYSYPPQRGNPLRGSLTGRIKAQLRPVKDS